MDEELYVETSTMMKALEVTTLSYKVRVFKQSLDDARAELNSLMDENELLQKIAVVEGLKDHVYVVDGELTFRRDMIVIEFEMLKAILFHYKCILVVLVGGIGMYVAYLISL